MKMVSVLLGLCLVCLGMPSRSAEAIAVPHGSADAAQAPTYTLLYENPKAGSTLVVVLGGEGRIGIHERTRDTRTQSALMTRRLAEDGQAGKPANVVIFDSPVHLSPVSMRSDGEHLDRIREVVLFYRLRFGLPVVLLGHSNGATSVTEYLNRHGGSADIAGLVVSASKPDIVLRAPLALPVLFLHHVDDACRLTPFFLARRNHEKVRAINARHTGLAEVRGGESTGDPCRDGLHMYRGAYDEAARWLGEFITAHVLSATN